MYMFSYISFTERILNDLYLSTSCTAETTDFTLESNNNEYSMQKDNQGYEKKCSDEYHEKNTCCAASMIFMWKGNKTFEQYFFLFI